MRPTRSVPLHCYRWPCLPTSQPPSNNRIPHLPPPNLLSRRPRQRLYDVVAKEVTQLRVVLEGLEAKEKERVWVKNQNQGELDDNKLVDGFTGERNIYKRRGHRSERRGRCGSLRLRWSLCVCA